MIIKVVLKDQEEPEIVHCDDWGGNENILKLNNVFVDKEERVGDNSTVERFYPMSNVKFWEIYGSTFGALT